MEENEEKWCRNSISENSDTERRVNKGLGLTRSRKGLTRSRRFETNEKKTHNTHNRGRG